MRRPRLSPWPLVLVALGCGDGMMPMEPSYKEAVPVDSMAGADAPPANTPPAQTNAQGTAPARKIIYNASLDLLVEDMAAAEAAIPRLVQAAGGYLSGQDLHGLAGHQRQGTWTARIPVDRFEAFLDSVAKLGEVQRSRRDSKDVTEQFFDTEARLKNKKVEEQRLVKLLEERTGKLEDVLSVEKELSRVRGEAEQLEGSLRLLANLTSLTTVTIGVTERRDYRPPQAPSFGTTIGRTFQSSLDALVGLGKGLVLVAVALTPWLPVFLLIGLSLWFLARKLRRVLRAPPALAPASNVFLDQP